MGKKEFLLCVTIPTYNREKYLKRLIESIVTQEGFSDEVSIVINDGPSKDNTRKIVEKYQKLYNNIFYSRNEKAVGMLPAILESIEMSNGEYTWLFGSDDFMHSQSLRIMLDIIKKNSPCLVLSKRYDFLEEKECKTIMNQNLDHHILLFHGFSDFSVYLGQNEPEKYADKANYFTFMSVFCFETKYYKESFNYVKQNVCSLDQLGKHYFNYIQILFSQLYLEKKICIVENKALVFCQIDNHGRQANNKISKDMNMLIKYVKNNYPLSKSGMKVLNKINIGCRVGSTLLPIIRKLGIGFLVNKVIKNKFMKNTYYEVISFFSG